MPSFAKQVRIQWRPFYLFYLRSLSQLFSCSVAPFKHLQSFFSPVSRVTEQLSYWRPFPVRLRQSQHLCLLKEAFLASENHWRAGLFATISRVILHFESTDRTPDICSWSMPTRERVPQNGLVTVRQRIPLSFIAARNHASPKGLGIYELLPGQGASLWMGLP